MILAAIAAGYRKPLRLRILELLMYRRGELRRLDIARIVRAPVEDVRLALMALEAEGLVRLGKEGWTS